MNMRVPVGHATEGLRHKDTAGKNIPAIKGFMKEYCKRIPGASAEFGQKPPVMQKVKPEHFRNTPYQVSVRNRSE
jgi:hypothetical protein